jgi:uncharacterized membrane protein YhaH (DUF805 family)
MAFPSMSNDRRSEAGVVRDRGDPHGIGAAIWSLLFSFRGSAGRLQYWTTVIGALIIGMTLFLAIALSLGADLEELASTTRQSPVTLNIVFLPFSWVIVAVTAKRLRDRGWSNEMIAGALVGLPVLTVANYFIALLESVMTATVLGCLLSLANLWVFIECGFLPSQD